MTALFIAITLIGVVVVINDLVTTPSTNNNIGNSSKPNHERVIKKSN